MRGLLQLLPFYRHQPPIGLPLRRLAMMSMERPVDLVEIESRILALLKNNCEQTLSQLPMTISYLRQHRFLRRDAPNLFVASVRAACAYDAEIGLEYSYSLIYEIPDHRSIRTMITYLNRLDRPDESLELLDLSKPSSWTHEMRRLLNIRVHGPPSELDDDTSSPWIFQITEPIRLNTNSQFIQYPIPIANSNSIDGIRRSFDLIGTIRGADSEPANATLANFLFFDENGDEIRGVEPGGLYRSKTVGWYSYLNHDSETGVFNVEFEPPNATAKVVVGFRLWNSKKKLLIEEDVDIRPSTLEEFNRDLQRFLVDVSQSDAKEVVFMFSGTTYVQELRANRPIRLTRDLLSRGIPVIFNYHRWRRTEESPPYQGDLLLQVPIDITQKILGDIAKFDLGDRRKIFVVSYPHPTIPKILNRFRINGWSTIYDARDEWEEFEKVGQAKWYRTFNENYIVHNVDHVTAVSWPLAKKLDNFNPSKPVEVVPNALSPHFLSTGYKWKGDKQVRVGYFGHLTDSWFDWDALIEIAKKRPKFEFEIIGHSEPDNLVVPSNINILGPKNHSEINEIAAKWSVAIIPFKMGPLADGVDPIKIYEYMALELPTVSFRMPQIDTYPCTITVDNIEDFCSALDEFARFRPRKGSLKSWLLKNRWPDRVDRFLELAYLEQKDNIGLLGGDN
jgi:hypothetical protein